MEVKFVELDKALNTMDVEIKILNKEFFEEYNLPEYETEEAGGFDIRAAIEEPLTLWPGDFKLVPAGFAVDLNNPYSAMLILPRSGLGGKKGIVLGNLVGLLDSDYQGEVGMTLWNRNTEGSPIVINRGDRVCQAFLVPIIKANFKKVMEFSRETERGEGGYGSTGVK